MSAIHQLAHLFLRDPSARRWPEIAASSRDDALAACGVGCDHIEGEELVAVLDDSKRRGVFIGAVITSRRYAWRNLSGCGEVRWSDLAHVEIERDVLGSTPRCSVLGGGRVRIPPTTADTTAFFHAVVRLRGEDRAVSIRPLPRGRSAARRVILERSRQHGRGQHFGSWISAMAPNDIARALAIVLGLPVASGAQGEHFVCDFALSPDWRRLGQLDSPPVQQRTLEAAGYAHAVERVRIVTQPLWPGCLFTMHGLRDGQPAAPLTLLNPVLLGLIQSELLRVEEQLLAAAPPPRPSAPALV